MMSENVIEKLAGEWEKDGDLVGPKSFGAPYMQCADELQAATRPEQFMPPLSTWPEAAEWCVIVTSGADDTGAYFFRCEPSLVDGGWSVAVDSWFALHGVEDPPLGIDWRTLKVSRAQMEAYENG